MIVKHKSARRFVVVNPCCSYEFKWWVARCCFSQTALSYPPWFRFRAGSLLVVLELHNIRVLCFGVDSVHCVLPAPPHRPQPCPQRPLLIVFGCGLAFVVVFVVVFVCIFVTFTPSAVCLVPVSLRVHPIAVAVVGLDTSVLALL